MEEYMLNATMMSEMTINGTSTGVYGLQWGTVCRVKAQAVQMFALLSVLSCTALIGNLLLLFVMASTYHALRNSATNARFTSVQILITYNCLADLLYVLLATMPKLLSYCGHQYSLYNRWLCKLEIFCCTLPMVASSSLLVAFSVDRFQAS